MPDYNFGYNLPSFQNIMGTSPTDILGLLQGYRSQNLAQELAGAKELAGMGYESQADLLAKQIAGQQSLAGMGYQSEMERLLKNIAAQKELAAMGYGSQRELQQLGGQQALEQMREQQRLQWLNNADAANQERLNAVLADAAKRRQQSAMWSAPRGGFIPGGATMMTAPVGYAGFNYFTPSKSFYYGQLPPAK